MTTRLTGTAAGQPIDRVLDENTEPFPLSLGNDARGREVLIHLTDSKDALSWDNVRKGIPEVIKREGTRDVKIGLKGRIPSGEVTFTNPDHPQANTVKATYERPGNGHMQRR